MIGVRRWIVLAVAGVLVLTPGVAQAASDPGWGGPDDPWPSVGYHETIPGYEDVSTNFTCPYGSGLGIVVDIGAGRTYGKCIKTWHSDEWYRLVEQERAAYEAVKQAAYEESLRLNTLRPGTQTCVTYTFTWQWAGSGQESGGVCANPVSAGSGDDTVVTPGPIDDTAVTPIPGPGPAPEPGPGDDTTVTPSPTDPGESTIDPVEEPEDSISVQRLASGRWRVEVTTSTPGTASRIVARAVNGGPRLVWNALATDDDGEIRFQTNRDLTGYRLRLIVGGLTVARVAA